MTEPTPQPETPIPLLRRETVAGAVVSYGPRQIRGLPWAFDDATRDFGDDIYERMQLDAQVVACVNIMRAAIIEDGMRLDSAVKDEAEDGFALAKEIRDFCDSVLCDLQFSIDDVLWDMLGAIALGSRVAEEVWDLRPATTYALPGTSPVSKTQDLLVLTALKPRPRRSTAFVVDPYMNVVGLLAKPPSGAQLSLSIVADNPKSVPNLIDRQKFAVLSFRPHDCDPRGSSALRPAYTAWWTKMQVWQEFLRYLAQFASPSTYAIASEQATREGFLIEQPDGSKLRTDAVTVLNEMLLAYKNGSALSVPYGTILGVLAASEGGGEAFHNAFSLCDRQISTAVLHQTLATMEAEHQSRASSETHENTLTTLQRQAKHATALMLRRDVLMPLVAYNYGPEAARQLCPVCSLGDVEEQDFPSTAQAIAQLANAQYLDPSQFAGLDTMLGLPPRTAMQAPEGTPQDQQLAPQPPQNDGQDQGDQQGQEGNQDA